MLYILADIADFCKNTSPIWQFIGYVVMVFKIAIPLLLIIFGMMDLGKAVVANDDKAIKSATTSLVKRAIAGVVIFFLPFLVSTIFGLVVGFGEVKTTYEGCEACVTKPTGKPCKEAVKGATNKEIYSKNDAGKCLDSSGNEVDASNCE